MGRPPPPFGDDGLPGGPHVGGGTGRPAADLVVRHAGELLTCADAAGARGRDGAGHGPAAVGLIADGAVAIAAGRILWVGPDAELADAVAVRPTTRVLDAGGRVVMPGLVECHTHVAFAGDRAAEYQLRVGGATYGEIAAAGGGILSTVRATRAASFEELRRAGARRLRALLEHGVTTVEVKSGYGLTVPTNCAYSRSTPSSLVRGRRPWCRRCWAPTPCRPSTPVGPTTTSKWWWAR